MATHRLYHPKLGQEITAHNDRQAAVYADAGWEPAPEPPGAKPGYEPEPTRYEPVVDEPAKKPAAKTTKKTDS